MHYNFFGKDCTREKLTDKMQEAGLTNKYPAFFVHQVHGNKVVVLDNVKKLNNESADLVKADAIVTNLKSLPIAVVTADCLPIIFHEEKNNISAVAHAGWRGAKAGIIENTIKEMLNLGGKTENIKTIIGPAIRQESYEVDKIFYQDFLLEDKNNKIFFINSTKPDHYLFDLVAYCIAKIKKCAIANIIDQKIDTHKGEKDFYSYRRATHQKIKNNGRNISVAIL